MMTPPPPKPPQPMPSPAWEPQGCPSPPAQWGPDRAVPSRVWREVRSCSKVGDVKPSLGPRQGVGATASSPGSECLQAH